MKYLISFVILTFLGGLLTSSGFLLNLHASSNSSTPGRNASAIIAELMKKTRSVTDDIVKQDNLAELEEKGQTLVPNVISNDKDITNNTGVQGSNSSNATGDEVVLLSHNLKKGKSILNEIVGEVRNIGNDTVQYVKIGLTGYDSNGDVIGTKSSYATPDTLKPNQKSSFHILFLEGNFKNMESYKLSLQWQNSNGTDEYVNNAQINKDQIQ